MAAAGASESSARPQWHAVMALPTKLADDRQLLSGDGSLPAGATCQKMGVPSAELFATLTLTVSGSMAHRD